MYQVMERQTAARGPAQQNAAGDPLVDFEAYVIASQAKHKRLAYLLTGDRHAAEDLLQSAYAKTYPKWDKVRTYDAPDAYLRRVMVSLRTSWWRRDRNREWSTDELPERGGAPDHAGVVAESQALMRALGGLPERQRAAVVLRHWCDVSEAETASIMGCSAGTVKSNTSKGLARLREALGQTEGQAS